MDPALVVGRQTTSRDHAMNVRMMLEVLAPGVEHAQEADLRAEMLGVGRNLQQSRGAGAEQEVVDDLLVLQSQPRKLVRQGEHDMHVADRQQFFAAFRQPLVASVGLALRAMPVAAGVERDGLMAASGTAIQVATECCRAAKLDGVQHAQMEPRQPGPVLCDEAVAVLSDDVGHLERWPVHRFCSFRERLLLSGLETADRRPAGWPPAVRCFCERCRYTDGVFELGVPQQHLDRAQVGAGFEQVSRVAVPQGVRRDVFGDAGPLGGLPAGVPTALCR